MPKNTGRSLQLVLIASLVLACTQAGLAEEFSLTIGSPVAAGSFRAKNAVFAIRSRGCPVPAKMEVSGAAEGLVDGKRRTVPLAHVAAMPTPGVYTVSREWPPEGVWVVNLTGRCDQAIRGVLVPIGPKGFLRESSKFFPRPAGQDEIDASLRSLAESLRQQTPGSSH